MRRRVQSGPGHIWQAAAARIRCSADGRRCARGVYAREWTRMSSIWWPRPGPQSSVYWRRRRWPAGISRTMGSELVTTRSTAAAGSGRPCRICVQSTSPLGRTHRSRTGTLSPSAECSGGRMSGRTSLHDSGMPGYLGRYICGLRGQDALDAWTRHPEPVSRRAVWTQVSSCLYRMPAGFRCSRLAKGLGWHWLGMYGNMWCWLMMHA